MSIEHAMNRKLQIHNSTAEFLIFQIENKEEGEITVLTLSQCYNLIMKTH